MDAMFKMPQNRHLAGRALHLVRLKSAAMDFFNALLGLIKPVFHVNNPHLPIGFLDSI